MKYIKHILLFFIFLNSFQHFSFAQNYADKEYYLVDSIKLDEFSENDKELLEASLKDYHQKENEIEKIAAINRVCENMVHQDWVKYNEWVYEFAIKKLNEELVDSIQDKFSYILAGALNNKGFISSSSGDNKAALNYFTQSIQLSKNLVGDKDRAMIMNNIATIYNNMGQVPKALNQFHKSLKIFESIGDTNGLAITLTNIGYIHDSQGDNSKALSYYFKALKIQTAINNKFGMANSLSNVGVVYGENGDYETDLKYSEESLQIREEIGDKNGIAKCLSNIGSIYSNYIKDNKKALTYFVRALEIRKEINDKQGVATNLAHIASIKMENNDLVEASKLANESFEIAQEIGYPEEIKSSAELLSLIYEKQGNYKKALEMYNLHIQMRDSLNNESTQKATAQQQAKYEYEKQKTIDDATHEKQIALEQEQQKKQRIISICIGVGLVLVVIFLLFVFNRLRVTRKQKIVIEQQRDEVEEAHKEIRDSINYAERIQRSFLATDELLNNNLKDYFVFFQPKDVVSGDFYWAGKLANNQFAVVNADSTGHGVPGAIMSILNISSIEKAIDQKLIKPADIFNHTRDTIIERLSKDGSEGGGKDGMDASIVSFDFENNKFTYTAAQNPIWVIRNNELIEIKGEKMPIGRHDNDAIPFLGGEFETEKGDVVYTITDGFQDQFGGEKGKKFKIKPFKNYLISIAHLPMQEQREKLAETFIEWKGNEEQVDDVCIIGVKL